MDYSRTHSYYYRLMLVGLVIFIISAFNIGYYYINGFHIIDIKEEYQSYFVGINSTFMMAGIFTAALMKSCIDHITIRKLAFHDELTGLINRRRFNELFKMELEESQINKKTLAIIALDLDRFKVINDCHGHEAGDKIIQQFAKRISASIRDHDVLCRMSGDEFMLLARKITSEEDIYNISNRVLDAMRKPFIFQNKHIYAGVSMGAVIIDNGSEEAAFAMRMADFALLRSKELGRGQLVLFDPEMEQKIKRRADLEIKLREALATDLLSLRYQPMLDHKKGRVKGVEALVRWSHPEIGEISPSEFIPLAEQLALMDQIGNFVLKRACHEIAQYDGIRLAININTAQLLQENFVETVARTLLETGFEAQNLELEIKQKLLADHGDVAKAKIQQLRNMGILIAIDDFGTGISSMSHMRDFTLDRVKLDRSFTNAMKTRGADDAFVSNMIGMAASLGKNVTVEGVETLEQATTLTKLGCDELQGFYFSKPLTADQLVEYGLPLKDYENSDAENVNNNYSQRNEIRLVS